MNLRLAVCIGFASQLLAGTALAQPALERVVKQLQKQSTTRLAAASDGDPAAADDANAAEEKNPPGYLGILVDDRQENGSGVRVTKVDIGGPAAKGGLATGDLIVTIDELPIKSMDDMGEIMSIRHAGALVKFGVNRKGETVELQVRLERRPPPEKRMVPQFGKQAEDMPAPAAGGPVPGAPAPAGPGDSVILGTRRPKLGIRTVNLTPFIREQTRLPGAYVAGVFVTYVDPDAPAGKAGLPTNSIITSVDGEPIDSPDTLKALIDRASPGRVLNVTYYYRDHETQTAVTMAGGPARPAAPGAQATVRAKPVPPVSAVPEQPPGFAPDAADPGDAPMAVPSDKIAELEHRIAELEKRVAELEAAAIVPAEVAPAEKK